MLQWVSIVFSSLIVTLYGLLELTNFVSKEDISTTNKMEGVFEDRNGERYLRLTAFDAFPNVRSMKIFATGIFPDAELSKLRHINNIPSALLFTFANVDFF